MKLIKKEISDIITKRIATAVENNMSQRELDFVFNMEVDVSLITYSRIAVNIMREGYDISKH